MVESLESGSSDVWRLTWTIAVRDLRVGSIDGRSFGGDTDELMYVDTERCNDLPGEITFDTMIVEVKFLRRSRFFRGATRWKCPA